MTELPYPVGIGPVPILLRVVGPFRGTLSDNRSSNSELPELGDELVRSMGRLYPPVMPEPPNQTSLVRSAEQLAARRGSVWVVNGKAAIGKAANARPAQRCQLRDIGDHLVGILAPIR